VEEEIEVKVSLRNVEVLNVKVFEINTDNYYR